MDNVKGLVLLEFTQVTGRCRLNGLARREVASLPEDGNEVRSALQCLALKGTR